MRNHPERNILFPLIFLVILSFSCDRNRFFEENTAIVKGTWNLNRKIRFEVPVNDTKSRYRFYVNLRNDMTYPYSNLFLFLTTTFPDGKLARDTMELTLADYDGRWLGSGMGGVRFNRFLFKKNVQFPLKGTYSFDFEQAMRVEDLKGICDIGLRIEKE